MEIGSSGVPFHLHLLIVDLDPHFCDCADSAFRAVVAGFPSLKLTLSFEVQSGALCSYLPRTDNRSSSSSSSNRQPPKNNPICPLCHLPQEVCPCCGSGETKKSTTTTAATTTTTTTTTSTPTVLIFGGNSAGYPSGNAQKSIAHNYPILWQEIQTHIQQKHGSQWNEPRWDGEIFSSQDHLANDNTTALCLISCTVFPRNACTEQDNCRAVFRDALFQSLEFASRMKNRKDVEANKIRVITHGLGVFTGHPHPELFAQSMAAGLGDFLADYCVASTASSSGSSNCSSSNSSSSNSSTVKTNNNKVQDDSDSPPTLTSPPLRPLSTTSTPTPTTPSPLNDPQYLPTSQQQLQEQFTYDTTLYPFQQIMYKILQMAKLPGVQHGSPYLPEVTSTEAITHQLTHLHERLHDYVGRTNSSPFHKAFKQVSSPIKLPTPPTVTAAAAQKKQNNTEQDRHEQRVDDAVELEHINLQYNHLQTLFRTTLHHFVQDVVAPLLGVDSTDLYYQKTPALRIVVPSNQSVGHKHCDYEYNHQPS